MWFVHTTSYLPQLYLFIYFSYKCLDLANYVIRRELIMCERLDHQLFHHYYYYYYFKINFTNINIHTPHLGLL